MCLSSSYSSSSLAVPHFPPSQASARSRKQRMRSAGVGALGGPGIITEAPDTAVGTGRVSITGVGAIVEAPDTTGIPPVVPEDFSLVTPGRLRREQKEKRQLRIESRDSPRLRQLREGNKKLAAERLRLEQIREQQRVLGDDAEMQEMLAREASKAAAEFSRVARDYISLDRKNKMMAMMMALLME